LGILKSIIKDEGLGEIDPINEYTRNTIKSFCQFISNGFKSEKDEIKGKRDIYESSQFDDYKKVHIENLDDETWILIEKVKNELESRFGNKIRIQHSQTHPISVFLTKSGKNGKILGVKIGGKKIRQIELIFRHFTIKVSELNRINTEKQQQGFITQLTTDNKILELKKVGIDAKTILDIFEELAEIHNFRNPT
jgi:hypothetical protein